MKSKGGGEGPLLILLLFPFKFTISTFPLHHLQFFPYFLFPVGQLKFPGENLQAPPPPACNATVTASILSISYIYTECGWAVKVWQVTSIMHICSQHSQAWPYTLFNKQCNFLCARYCSSGAWEDRTTINMTIQTPDHVALKSVEINILFEKKARI